MYLLKMQGKCVTEDFKRVLSTGWKVSDPYPISRQEEYVKRVVEELKAIPRLKIPPTTTQCASTQAVLDRDPSKDAEYWNRSIPENWKAVPDADLSTPEGRDKAVAKRNVDPTEVAIAEDARRKSKNTIGDSEASSVTPEKRERGIWAFTYSKPVQLTPEQLKKVTKLEEIVNTPIEPKKPKKVGVFGKIKGFLQGNAGMEMFDDADTH